MDNVSVVRIFTLTGLNETMDHRTAIFSLTLVYYCVVLFLNISLIVIIVLDENLHEPMYVLLCCVCINAVYGTTGFYPKFLLDLLSFSQEMSYGWCLFQTSLLYYYACCELSILALMAYDRYLAICRPLHYHTLMTRRRLSQLVSFSWLTPFCIVSINILATSRLELCGFTIRRLFCVNWIIVKLACPNSNTLLNNIASYAAIVIYVSHGFFIVWTYMHLVRTCATSKDDRMKFMQTCVPHLISLTTFVTVIVFDLMYMRFGSAQMPQSLQNLIAIEYLLFPPMMNPLIYGFKLTKIRNRILSLIYVRIQ
ncbi:olfactory receptor 4Q2-like [Fundulus heteroclitus]|uniref:olfactory receptor 4Q2-like n=1 Tax=Fundulus heteroclitus TaxID=8078 RepID=UPI00165A9660|nr:olfactory receptor 4Q2-like [Fundulus heteroclitus]